MKYFIFVSCLVFNVCWAESVPKNSIYHLTSTWRDQNNKSVQLKDFAGQKVIIGMVYTSCPHACPMTISKIQEIERKIAAKTKENFKIILASFDPAKDTPAHNKNYMKKRKLDEARWTFLSAPDDAAAREMAVVLDINYKRLEDGEFSHSNVISLLDDRGVRIAKIESLSAEGTPIVGLFKSE